MYPRTSIAGTEQPTSNADATTQPDKLIARHMPLNVLIHAQARDHQCPSGVQLMVPPLNDKVINSFARHQINSSMILQTLMLYPKFARACAH